MSESKKAKPKLTDAERHKRFVETAKRVEAPDNIEAFDRVFDQIVSNKRTQLPPSQKR